MFKFKLKGKNYKAYKSVRFISPENDTGKFPVKRLEDSILKVQY